MVLTVYLGVPDQVPVRAVPKVQTGGPDKVASQGFRRGRLPLRLRRLKGDFEFLFPGKRAATAGEAEAAEAGGMGLGAKAVNPALSTVQVVPDGAGLGGMEVLREEVVTVVQAALRPQLNSESRTLSLAQSKFLPKAVLAGEAGWLVRQGKRA